MAENQVQRVKKWAGKATDDFRRSLCYIVGDFKYGARFMTIRSLTRSWNILLLTVTTLFCASLFILGMDLYHRGSRLDEVGQAYDISSHIEYRTRARYALAREFARTGNRTLLAMLEETRLQDQGSLPRREGGGQDLPELPATVAALPLDAMPRTLLTNTVQLYKTFADQISDAARQAAGDMPTHARPHVMPESSREAMRNFLEAHNMRRQFEMIIDQCRDFRHLLRRNITLHAEELRHSLKILAWACTGALALIGILILVFMRLRERRFIDPLRRMHKYVLASRRGETAPRPLPDHNDELSDIFRALCGLQDDLEARIRALDMAEKQSRENCRQAELARHEAEDATRLSRQALAAREDLLRRMSHELRTPINELLGMSFLLLKTPLQPRQQAYVRQIQQSGGRLTAMIDRILEFSSLADGQQRPDEQPVRLVELLERTIRPFAAIARQHRLGLALEAAPDLPLQVMTDALRLRRVLENLLDNALRYSNRGTVLLSARVLPSPDGAAPADRVRVLFEVADNGPGFSEAARKHIFEPLASGDSSLTRTENGIGMGLALAHQLVRLLGGQLELESRPQGSSLRFSLSLPVLEAAVPHPASCRLFACENQPDAPAPENATASDEKRPCPRILVVDDNEINREILQELISQMGCRVSLAANGEEAIRQTEQQPPDLIITDMQMPVMDGMETTRRIRGNGHSPQSLPIIALSAHTDSASHIAGLAAGMNDYLTKPVDPEKLRETLEKWLPCGLPAAAETPPPPREAEETWGEAPAGNDALPLLCPQDGLAAVAGNERLYRSLLQRFAHHYADCTVQIRGLLQDNRLEELLQLIHAMRGVGTNLGLARFADQATAMENSLLRQAPEPERTHRFLQTLDESRQAILAYCGGEEERREQGCAPVPPDVRSAAEATLTGLPGLMERDWGTAETLAAQLHERARGTCIAEHLARLLQAINEFDAGGVRRCCEAVRDALETSAADTSPRR